MVDVSRGNIKEQVENVVREVINKYHFLTFTEYKAVLTKANIAAEEVKGSHYGSSYSGIVYSATDNNDNKIGNPFSSATLGKFAGSESLERKYRASKEYLEKSRPAAPHYFKITKKAKRTIDLNECKALAKKFKFNVDSYAQDGLLLDLQGVTPLSTYKGKNVWIDNSINENHAEIINGATAGITHDPATKSYILQGTSLGMFTAMKQIGDVTNCTVEVVTKPENTQNSLIYLGNPTYGGIADNQRVFHIHYPWNTNITVSSPRAQIITVPITSLTYPKIFEQAAQLSIIRDGSKGKMSFYQNSVFQGETSVVSVLPAINTVIGGQSDGSQPYKGRIYAVRIYNRTLTDAERRANYELDKKTYNLP